MGINIALSQSTESTDDSGLESRILNQLYSCGYPELGRISIRMEDRTVTLEGRVCSYYLKQVAQTIECQWTKS